MRDRNHVHNIMYHELENLINANDAENAGILLAAIICQDAEDLDTELFLDSLQGDLP